MHTSVGAAGGRDDGAPEVSACCTFRISNLSEMLLRVNRKASCASNENSNFIYRQFRHDGFWAGFRSIAIATTWFKG
jgi:hypothetical protein